MHLRMSADGTLLQRLVGAVLAVALTAVLALQVAPTAQAFPGAGILKKGCGMTGPLCNVAKGVKHAVTGAVNFVSDPVGYFAGQVQGAVQSLLNEMTKDVK
jgi:hypothetical protein